MEQISRTITNFFRHIGNSKRDDDILPINSTKSVSASSSSLLLNIKLILKAIFDAPDSRKIFYFLMINFAFMFVELFFGIITNSLGLVGDAFHMLFDCTALAIGLYASVISKWKANKTFTYGFGRVEVLSGFVNGIFLCFIALSIFFKSIKRIISPQEIYTENLLLVSVLGLIVNLIGIFSFHDIPFVSDLFKKNSSHEHTHDHHGHSHHNHHGHHHHHGKDHDHHHGHGHHHGHSCSHEHSDNMYGIFLHIVADALGSVSVIISSILIKYYGWKISDPICSLLLSSLIFASVIPLLKSSVNILMQISPTKLENKVLKHLSKVSSIPGVIAYSNPHFWANTPQHIIGSIHLYISPQSNEQVILKQAQEIFEHANVEDMTIQIIKNYDNEVANTTHLKNNIVIENYT